jgi:hypothetical protein
MVTELPADVTGTDQMRYLSDAEMAEVRAEIDRFADAVEPLVLYRLFAHDLDGLDLTLLKAYLREMPNPLGGA